MKFEIYLTNASGWALDLGKGNRIATYSKLKDLFADIEIILEINKKREKKW